MVEQRGIEPLTSALRTRRSAKLSYCPTRVAILGSAVEQCQACAVSASSPPEPVSSLWNGQRTLTHSTASSAASANAVAALVRQRALNRQINLLPLKN